MNLKYYTIKTQNEIKNFENKEDGLNYYHTLKDGDKKIYETMITFDGIIEKEIHPIKKEIVEITWYEITNTVDEYHSACTGKYDTYEGALEGLKSKEDFCCERGTGKISKCRIDNLTYTIEREELLRK